MYGDSRVDEVARIRAAAWAEAYNRRRVRRAVFYLLFLVAGLAVIAASVGCDDRVLTLARVQTVPPAQDRATTPDDWVWIRTQRADGGADGKSKSGVTNAAR